MAFPVFGAYRRPVNRLYFFPEGGRGYVRFVLRIVFSLFPIVLAPAAFFPFRQGVALYFASHFPLQIACIVSPWASRPTGSTRGRRVASIGAALRRKTQRRQGYWQGH
jgi:hypothetical protein